MFQVTRRVFSGGRAASKDDAKQSEFQHGQNSDADINVICVHSFNGVSNKVENRLHMLIQMCTSCECVYFIIHVAEFYNFVAM